MLEIIFLGWDKCGYTVLLDNTYERADFEGSSDLLEIAQNEARRDARHYIAGVLVVGWNLTYEIATKIAIDGLELAEKQGRARLVAGEGIELSYARGLLLEKGELRCNAH